MSPEVKASKKAEFKKALKGFAEELEDYVSSEDGQWSVKGFIDVFRNIYTITADTKIVSKILEVHLFPKILAFAERNRLRVVLAEKQNWYPDFSFVGADDPAIKFAVDLKTTYRNPKKPGFVNGFTLGSHGEYFTKRTSTKNIQYPYSEYLGHFCLGAIYTRTVEDDLTGMEVYSVKDLGSDPGAADVPEQGLRVDKQEKDHQEHEFHLDLKDVENLQSITSVVRDFEFFACEKWELASDKAGSGNTANIGGIQERALEIGKEAREFTRQKLSKPFTVWTRWRDGLGRAQRYCVMIQTAEGKWLCEELVRAGLARVYGIRTPPPEKTGAKDSREWRVRLNRAR